MRQNMKRICLSIIISCLIIGVAHTATVNEHTLIALLVNKEDLLKNNVHDEVLLIGKYFNGKYDVVSRWDEKQQAMISERKDLLQSHKKYTVYQNGRVIKEAVVNEICQAMYDCEAIDIGCSQTTLLTTAKNIKGRMEKEYEGFNNGIDFKERTSAFIAINSDSPAVKKQKSAIPPAKISPDTIAKISKYITKRMLESQTNIRPKDIKIGEAIAFNLTRDNLIQYIVEAKAENDKIKGSGIYVVQLVGSNIKELFSVSKSNDPDSWGNGYSFVDAVDIDADGLPELIFEVRGYESTGCQIYHLDKDGYKMVFDHTISGC